MNYISFIMTIDNANYVLECLSRNLNYLHNFTNNIYKNDLVSKDYLNCGEFIVHDIKVNEFIKHNS